MKSRVLIICSVLFSGVIVLSYQNCARKNFSTINSSSVAVVSVDICDNGTSNFPICNVCDAGRIFDGSSCVVTACANGATNSPACNVCLPGYSHVGNSCVLIPCSSGQINPPNCNVCAASYTHSSSGCVASACSNGTTNPPICNTCPGGKIFDGAACVTPACNNGGNNPPACDKCPTGYSYNGSVCAVSACSNGAINPPICNMCGSGKYFNGVACVATACSNGATNFPQCNMCPSGMVYNGIACVTITTTTVPSTTTTTVPRPVYTGYWLQTAPPSCSTFACGQPAQVLYGDVICMNGTCDPNARPQPAGNSCLANPACLNVSLSLDAATIESTQTTYLRWASNGNHSSLACSNGASSTQLSGVAPVQGLAVGNYTCSFTGVMNATTQLAEQRITRTVSLTVVAAAVVECQPMLGRATLCDLSEVCPNGAKVGGNDSYWTPMNWNVRAPINQTAWVPAPSPNDSSLVLDRWDPMLVRCDAPGNWVAISNGWCAVHRTVPTSDPRCQIVNPCGPGGDGACVGGGQGSE